MQYQLKNKLTRLVLSILILFTGLMFAVNITSHEHVMPTVPTISLKDTKQIACLAKNIFYEAGSETIYGQAAVARVVMNRVAYGFASNPCEVVYQKTTFNDKLICQFSWVCEGRADPNKNSDKYKAAEQVAYEVIVNKQYMDIIPKSALFFHSIHIDPLWPYKQVAVIGNHVFYSKSKKPSNK